VGTLGLDWSRVGYKKKVSCAWGVVQPPPLYLSLSLSHWTVSLYVSLCLCLLFVYVAEGQGLGSPLPPAPASGIYREGEIHEALCIHIRVHTCNCFDDEVAVALVLYWFEFVMNGCRNVSHLEFHRRIGFWGIYMY
jgi:hypothetical protein